ATAGGWGLFHSVQTFGTSVLPTGINSLSPAWVSPSLYRFSFFALREWQITKTWELEDEFGMETMCSQVYTAIYGAAVSPVGYLNRCWYSGAPFKLAYHLASQGPPLAGSTLDLTDASYYYQSNVTYI